MVRTADISHLFVLLGSIVSATRLENLSNSPESRDPITGTLEYHGGAFSISNARTKYQIKNGDKVTYTKGSSSPSSQKGYRDSFIISSAH